MSKKPGLKLNWKYALGEILLIFIGISLAIAFQNFNENRKDKIKIKGYLATIADNVTSDSVEISRFVEVSRQKKESGEKYINAVRKTSRSLSLLWEESFSLKKSTSISMTMVLRA